MRDRRTQVGADDERGPPDAGPVVPEGHRAAPGLCDELQRRSIEERNEARGAMNQKTP